MIARTPGGIDIALAQARAGLDRLEPAEACEAVRAGAVLVDIRPEQTRAIEGELPAALLVDRNELEWRLDPTSETCLPIASYRLHVILVCNEGYASSLAAAALQRLGLDRATDLIGGYRAWRTGGLPTIPPRIPDSAERLGGVILAAICEGDAKRRATARASGPADRVP